MSASCHCCSDADYIRTASLVIKQLCSVSVVLLLTASAAGAHETEEAAKVTLVYEHGLPNVPGKSMKGLLVEAGPGASNEALTDLSPAFIDATVLQGAVRSQINDGPVNTYRVGESISESPGERHLVSANASTAEPARLLAVLFVNTAEKELVFPIK